MMFWRRENYLNYPVLVFHGEGARDGIASQGSLVGTVALWQAVWRKQVWGRYSSSLPFGPYQAAVLGGQKKAETAISFSLLEYHVLGHSQHTGRWHRVTSANLWRSRIVSFFLCVGFCLEFSPLVVQWKGVPNTHTHTFPASQGRCDIGLEPASPELKEVICWHLHFPKGLHTPRICLSQIQGTSAEGGQCLLFKSWPLLLCTGKQFPPGLVDRDWKPVDLFKTKSPQFRKEVFWCCWCCCN